MKIIIVGGVAGGASVAARLRRLSENSEIIMFERDEHISYANCGLPYYIGGVIKDKAKLVVQTKEVMKDRFDIDVRVKSEVLAIDIKEKTVKVKNLVNNKEYVESYDKLVLSCGARPIIPKIEGLEGANNVFSLRNLADTYLIKEKTQSDNIKKAVVIGGGFIGIEMAENLKELGIAVTLVEKLPQVLRNLDFEMAQFVHAELKNNGVEIILNDGIKSFADGGKKVVLDSGKVLDTDMTILAMGVAPENTLAKESISLGVRGHVKVDDNFNVYLQNGQVDKDVYAIGDMIEVYNSLDDLPYAVPLAWGANRQGRLVADNIAGLCNKKSRISGTSALKVFNLTVASTGANETTLKDKKIEYLAIHAHRSNHASYYPDSSNIAMKILYDGKSGRIYGVQAIGREGTEKRIDVIATVMRLNGSIYDLSDLELCYAPPYSSAKDPVNILGYIAENMDYKMYKMVYHDQIEDIVKDGGFLLDVRTPFEFANGHIEGSINVPIDEFRTKIKEVALPTDKPIYVTCQVGLKAYIAIRILAQMGYKNLFNLSGGYVTYKIYKYDYNKKLASEFIKGGDDMQNNPIKETKCEVIDVCGIQCPGPLMATYKAVEALDNGEKLKIISTDGGFAQDISSWCETNGHTLLSLDNEKGKYVAILQKGKREISAQNAIAQENATLVVFSGDLDKVIASMIIAQGAAAQGKNVTMFFTFWGLNALRKQEKVKVKKSGIEKMFGMMMPRGASRLGLSRMNMGGMGSKMIKNIMRSKNVDDLPTMLEKAQEVGVKMIACTMSMELMGIKKEELLEGVEYAGVATYISKNENVGTTLFI